MVKQHQEEIKEERDVFVKSFNSSINRVITNLECSHAKQNIIMMQMQEMMKEHIKKFAHCLDNQKSTYQFQIIR